MRIASFFISLFLILFIFSCTTTEPPDKEDPPDPVVIPSLGLAEDDAHCTEAWLKLTSEDIEFPAELILRQYNPSGDSLSFQFSLTTDDTLFYIDSLFPGQGYSFMAWFTNTDSLHPPSNKLSVTTMDTTSHDFTFDMLTFGGETGSSYLYDVAIIDKNDIWAVGKITIGDSSSRGYSTFNAVHWDGIKWNLQRIYFHSECSAVDYPGLKAIWAFDEKNIVLTNGGAIGWFNGDSIQIDCSINSILTGAINKIWGSGSDNIYTVGNSGNLHHYDGVNWQKLESGTELNINDIWGDYNEKTGQWEILAVAGNILHGHEAEIILINNYNCVISGANEIVWPLKTVWFDSPKEYFVAGSGIFQKHNIQDKSWGNDIFQITTYSINKIRGGKINNLIAVGGVGELLHFNGNNWKSFLEQSKLDGGNYYGCAIENNLMVAVGQNSASAVISMLLEF